MFLKYRKHNIYYAINNNNDKYTKSIVYDLFQYKTITLFKLFIP